MRAVLLGLVLAGLCGPGRASEPGSEAIVVFNTRMAESRSLAEYYARLRAIPTNHLFGFDLPTNEEISRASFRDSLQRPLAKELAARKLWRVASKLQVGTNDQASRMQWKVVESKVRYAVLCYGVPLKIAADPFHKDPGIENLRPELRRNEAAVDSEMALLPLFDEHLPLAGPLSNPVYGITNGASIHPTNGVLMVSRLDGPTPALARGLVDKALKAESEGLWGRAYFDGRSVQDPAMKLGENWISTAAEVAQKLGFETVIDTNATTFPVGFPMSHTALYFGWYTEHADGPVATSAIEVMPGAFGYHLHSFSAFTLRSTNQHWVGPLIARGFTAAMGTVYEPYLSGTPDVSVFPSRLIYFGFSYGEAAYASQHVLSWQTTVVGDPLYRPYKTDPETMHKRLEQSGSSNIEWSFLRLVNLNMATGKSLSECASLLEQLEVTKQSAVLSEKLGAIYERLGKPSSAVQTWQNALNQSPSPQQRIRISNTLAEKFSSLNRDAEAYEVLQKLAADPVNLQRRETLAKLAVMARKLDKPEEAKKHEAEAARLSSNPGS